MIILDYYTQFSSVPLHFQSIFFIPITVYEDVENNVYFHMKIFNKCKEKLRIITF